MFTITIALLISVKVGYSMWVLIVYNCYFSYIFIAHDIIILHNEFIPLENVDHFVQGNIMLCNSKYMENKIGLLTMKSPSINIICSPKNSLTSPIICMFGGKHSYDRGLNNSMVFP